MTQPVLAASKSQIALKPLNYGLNFVQYHYSVAFSHSLASTINQQRNAVKIIMIS